MIFYLKVLGTMLFCWGLLLFLIYRSFNENAKNSFINMQKSLPVKIGTFIFSPVLLIVWLFNYLKGRF